MAATTPLDRAVAAVRRAQDASDKLNALLAKRADPGHYVRGIADTLATELALAEASLLAAQPRRLTEQVELPQQSHEETKLWLDLGMG